MSFEHLVRRFSQYPKFPIPVDDVRDWLIDRGFQDEIKYYPVETDPEVIRGSFRRFTRHDAPYGEPIFCMQVLYTTKQDENWRRLVCCKEMLHVFDYVEEQVRTEEDVARLVKELAGAQVEGASLQTMSDWLVQAKALLVLAPISVVRQLRVAYEEGKTDDDKIAEFFGIPAERATYVMSRHFESAAKLFLKQE